MSDKTFTLDAAHRYFGVECNNAIWPLIEKEGTLTEDEKIKMVGSAHAALLHWSAFSGCKVHNRVRGLYMIAKAYTWVEDTKNAQYYAQQCFDLAFANEQEVADFDLAYGHEALARAAALAENKDEYLKHFNEAKRRGEALNDEEDKKIFMGDLLSGKWFG